MRSRTTTRFRKLLAELPADVQRQARKAYLQFREDPWHSSLRFKRVHPQLPVYSARITLGYRALGRRNEEGVVWFWIGSHSAYDELLKRL